jgi:hypothetical protein
MPTSRRSRCVAAVFFLAVACTGSGGESPEPETIELLTDDPLTLTIPAGWSYVEFEPGGHFVGLAAASNPEPLEDVRDDRPDVEGFRGISGDDVSPGDVFVELHVSYPPPSGEPRHVAAFPRALRPRHFTAHSDLLGGPVYELTARGRDRGYYTVRYWVGPEADDADAEAAVELATSIDA